MTDAPTISAARERSPWLERVAHALPYLLFAAAMLLLDSIGRGATQEEFFKSLQDSVNNVGPHGSGVTWRGFAYFLGAIGLVVALVILNDRLKTRAASGPRRRGPAKPHTLNQPRKLMKEVVKAAGLSGEEVRQLKALADQHGHGSPLTLLV